ncbi:MAG: hypothetical protein H5T69_04450 [Chloroflexi bacterium]|nr:hypothetical protein [Chloroflexota bacterium]
MSEAYRSMVDHDTWPEFAVPWNDNTPGPTDMSFLLPKPAGAQGFIRIVDGHLATGEGKRWRMWGLNICTDMPLPPMPYAPVVARRLAKYGCNCLRLHAIDHRWPNGILMRAREGSAQNRWWGGQDESTRALDPEALARLDYFIFCCKREGIYLDLNLNVARTFTEADGVREADLVRWGKGLTYFDDQLIALQKEYAAQLLQHVNPFTGLRYGEEPAIALIELVNENSLLEFWERGLLAGDPPDPMRGHWYPIPASYVADLDRRWNAWLRARYPDRAALAAAWEGDLAAYEDPALDSVRRLRRDEFSAASAARFRDEAQFYTDLEIAFFSEMKRYLRETLGAKQLILGTSDHNHGWSALPMLEANATLDVMDGHFYWQHPRSHRPGYPWRHNDWWIANTPMVDDPDASVVAHCSRSAVLGKPYIVSEVNEPFPNDHAAEFIPIIAAYGSLQDWDGILFYDYDGSWATPYWLNEEWREPPKLMTFALGTDPVKWTQFGLGALTFLRGDVRAARQVVERRMPHDWVLESLRRPSDSAHPYWMPWLPGRLALMHRTAIASFQGEVLSPPEGQRTWPEERIVSDTGELVWEARPKDGRVLIDTPRHQAIVGRAGRRATSHMELELETPFAAVQLASLDGQDIARSERMLLSTGARVANTGMRWADETRQSLSDQWGTAPIRIEPVVATVTLRGLAGAKAVWLQPLDGCGQPMGEPRAFAAADEGFAIRLEGEPATPWYLVRVERSA